MGNNVGLIRYARTINILLYTPDNGVTRNFMPHLWTFPLKAPLTLL